LQSAARSSASRPRPHRNSPPPFRKRSGLALPPEQPSGEVWQEARGRPGKVTASLIRGEREVPLRGSRLEPRGGCAKLLIGSRVHSRTPARTPAPAERDVQGDHVQRQKPQPENKPTVPEHDEILTPGTQDGHILIGRRRGVEVRFPNYVGFRPSSRATTAARAFRFGDPRAGN
jgi:hypothetical protein